MSKTHVGIIIVLAAAACGPNKGRNGGGPGGGGVDGNGGGPGWDAPACATSVVKAQKIPLDIYMMLDQSGSMSDSTANGQTKWANVTSAIDTFVQQPNLDGVSVGIQYFGLPPGGGGTCSVATCSTNSDCGASACGPCTFGVCVGFLGSGGSDSCNAADYAPAAVEIAPLPGVAPAIHQSMAGHSPTTSTPTSAALQGAIDHAKSWAQSHASDAVVVVLATDGDPSECDTSIPNIAAIANAGATGMPKILTFVIGVGSSTSNLNAIAQGGGTNMAYLVDTGSNVNQQFLDAMNAIRGAALGCQYTIPAPMNGMQPDYNAVNVVFTPGGGGPQTLPYVMSAANCPANGDGWYYDNAQNPTTIILCGSSCTKVEGDPMGEVDVTLGCSTVIL